MLLCKSVSVSLRQMIYWQSGAPRLDGLPGCSHPWKM